jgi:hypothetical protein
MSSLEEILFKHNLFIYKENLNGFSMHYDVHAVS